MVIVPENGNNVQSPDKAAGLPLRFRDAVLLVGGGARIDGAFDLARARCGPVLAADGGADAVLARGLIPEAVIGDMDSLSEAARPAIPRHRLWRIAEQDSTDFDKALRSIEAPLILAVGFSGARLDHELAALHGLVRHAGRPVIVIGAEDISFHVPPLLCIDLPVASRLSLFPLDAVETSASGLEWSFESLALHPARRIGTSNAVRTGRVTVRTHAPGLLMILPLAALDAAITALARADFPSPRP